VGIGGTSGVVTDHWDILSLVIFQSELVGGAYGDPDRSNISKNGSNK
jgi:hypothetical protein